MRLAHECFTDQKGVDIMRVHLRDIVACAKPSFCNDDFVLRNFGE